MVKVNFYRLISTLLVPVGLTFCHPTVYMLHPYL
jgi:hypothetical protein